MSQILLLLSRHSLSIRIKILRNVYPVILTGFAFTTDQPKPSLSRCMHQSQSL